ncbi:hypothetical protein QBC38DRAFT_104486 [Podospora fimiseda]|uniref:Translation machinery-associated protein 17 n=1 Tax=Podospora fimiseda TaxID=252190 RepID=A0AAN7BU59_9PEZI|nr:hypothetical protein QBC38DRAFT_104486 [Podospora fimiseda]
MSSTTEPITPTRFTSALKDLSLPSLHLKVLELRNSLAHLDYSNEQLRPFAFSPDSPDKDCLEAIQENEQVIERMQERIHLIRQEVESRGFSWTEFQSKEELEALDKAEPGVIAVNGEGQSTEGQERHPAWMDGTFQTGRITGDGELRMDPVPDAGQQQGGSISDEELRRRMEERLRDLGVNGSDGDQDEEGGMHL